MEKYIVIKLSEVKLLYSILNNLSENELKKKVPPELLERFNNETGADIEDIANQLKKLPLCPACILEGQERSCKSLDAQKLGRRLYRLIQRANYINTEY